MLDLLKSPAYAVPLVINVTGSIWFFLLVGKAGEHWDSFFERNSLLDWKLERKSSMELFLFFSFLFFFHYTEKKKKSRAEIDSD